MNTKDHLGRSALVVAVNGICIVDASVGGEMSRGASRVGGDGMASTSSLRANFLGPETPNLAINVEVYTALLCSTPAILYTMNGPQKVMHDCWFCRRKLEKGSQKESKAQLEEAMFGKLHMMLKRRQRGH